MLGNFSFGDYFKREAINWAWEFLTDKKWLGLPAGAADRDRLQGRRRGGRDLGRRTLGSRSNRIERCDEDENFWPASAPSQGPDGVCGPCSEIYFHPEGRSRSRFGTWCSRSSIAWAIRRTTCGRCRSKNIDTGMGLERCASTLQGVPTNYHIDSILPIVHGGGGSVRPKYEYESDNGRRLRRITDHVRACTFAVHENVYPGANKEKYVVKRLLRRAVLDGHQMGLREPFLHKLVPTVVEMMKRPYPELAGNGEARERRHREGRSELLRHDRRGAQSHRARVRRDAARQSRDGRWGGGGRVVSDVWRAAGAVRVAGGRAQPGVRLARLRARRWKSMAKSRARCSTR